MALTSAKSRFFVIFYFNDASLSALIKKAIGFSHPSSCFYNKTTAIVCSDANGKIMKSLSN